MADTIKIPFGFVIAASTDEWAQLTACVRLALSILKDGEQPEDITNAEDLEKLLYDLIAPKSTYGSGAMN